MRCPQADFIQYLTRSGVDLNDVIVVPGFYDRSLTRELHERHKLIASAVIHVDCDLYESTVPVLYFIAPSVVDGTTICFDDWFYYKGHPDKGERGAFEAWLRRNPGIIASELSTLFPKNDFVLSIR